MYPPPPPLSMNRKKVNPVIATWLIQLTLVSLVFCLLFVNIEWFFSSISSPAKYSWMRVKKNIYQSLNFIYFILWVNLSLFFWFNEKTKWWKLKVWVFEFQCSKRKKERKTNIISITISMWDNIKKIFTHEKHWYGMDFNLIEFSINK